MLRGTSSLFNSNGLLASFAMSRDQSETDAKTVRCSHVILFFPDHDLSFSQSIDHDLKHACEELISQCADAAAQPVRTFLERCTAFIASRDISQASEALPTSFSLPDQDFASPTKVSQVDGDFRESCEREFSVWLKRLKIYLEDDKTVSVLVAPLQTKIVEAYDAFRDLIGREYPREVADSLLSPMDFWSLLNRLCTEHNISSP
jgi:hypothetical protein